MQNRPLLLLVLTLIATSGTALSTPSTVKAEEWGLEIGLRSGFRQDDIRIEGEDAFGGTAVTDLSDTKIHHLELYGRAVIQEGLYYRGSIALGWYYDGQLVASEDGDDGPASLFPLGLRPFQVIGEVDGEMTFDVKGGIGYQLSFYDDRLQFAPLGGYSFHKNNVKATDTIYTLFDGNVTFGIGPNVGFDTEWIGPWVGFDATGWITPVWSLLVEFEYHWLDVEGTQRLITPNEPRTGSGDGISWGVATRYRFSKIFTGELMYRGHSWSAETARDFSVTWDSSLLTAGLVVQF